MTYPDVTAAPSENVQDGPLHACLEIARTNKQATTAALGTLAAARASATADLAMYGDVVDRLVCSATPLWGLIALFDSGWGELLLPEVAALDLDQGDHQIHKDNLRHSLQVCAQAVGRRRVRWAALLHDVGKAPTRQIAGGKVTFYHHEAVGRRLAEELLARLGYGNDFAEQVGSIVELSGRTHSFDDQWSDAAIRRFIVDAGEFVDDVLDLSRADCTSRRAGRKAEVQAQVDAVAARIAAVRAHDALRAVRPALDGQAIMRILNLEPGPEVGRAYRWLLGFAQAGETLSAEEAEARLIAWWAEHAAN